jgi:PilZ domain
VNSKALAHAVPPAAAAANVASTPAPTLTHQAAAKNASTLASASGAADLLVGRFLRSFQVLVSTMRLYQRNHPRVMESLESVEGCLQATFRQCRAVDLHVERGRVTLLADQTRHQPQALGDPRGELRILVEELTDAGVNRLTFAPRTNLSELELFAQAVNATSRAATQHRGERGAGNRDWSGWLAEHQIAGIRVNAPAERRDDDTILAILLGALPGAEHVTGAEPFPESTIEQLREALRFLAAVAPRLQEAQRQSPQEAARIVRSELAGTDPHTLGLIKCGLVIDPPQQGDTTASYFSRLGNTLVVDFLRAGHRAGRIPALEVRPLIDHLSRCGMPAIDEAQIEMLVEHFWASLPAREKASVLASRDAWCIPVPVLRRYIEPLIAAAERKGAEASGREARRALADFASCVESEEEKGRRAAAAGLIELADLLERLWPHPRFGELRRKVVDALLREPSPGIAGLLAAATETLARLALQRGMYAEFEHILDGLAQAPRDGEHEPIAALARRIVAQERWLLLVDAALANRPLDPALPKLLGRDPERLLDRLGLLLTSPDGADALPAMARLVRAAGEPVLGALQSHLSEPRRQRIATAIKLLAAVQPERLAAALPRALAAWDWSLQDLAVSELARQPAAALRTRIAEVFLAILKEAHAFVVPSMLDQIALAGDAAAAPSLIEIAAGKVDAARDLFIRIKAMEALGHLRAESAAPMLRELVRGRSGMTYVEPAGLRSAAEEALALIENRPGSARLRAAKQAAERSGARFERPRRYVRAHPSSPLSAKLEPHATSAAVHVIALGGALIETKRRLVTGETLRIEIHIGLRRIAATAVVRTIHPEGYGIEFVHMKQEDREKLRSYMSKLLR